MRFIVTLLAVLMVASAFTSPAVHRTTSPKNTKPIFMFSADDRAAAKPLTEIKEGDSVDVLKDTMSSVSTTSTKKEEQDPFKRPPAKTMTVKNRNTGEFYEVEVNESFLANEKFEMSWWAWVGFVIFPVVLLTNDVFHYLPKDGPLGFLGRI